MKEKIIKLLIEHIQDNHGSMNVKVDSIRRKAKIVTLKDGNIHASVDYRGKRYFTIIETNNL